MRATSLLLAVGGLALLAAVRADHGGEPVEAASGKPTAIPAQDLRKAVQELGDLRLKYAEDHPLVQHKRAQLKALEAEIANGKAQYLLQEQLRDLQERDSVSSGPPGATVDLNWPGAMDRLKRDNPAHHKKVQAILASASTLPSPRAEQFVRATYDAKDVFFGPVVLTSDPPKVDLRFRLDDVVYSKRVMLRVSATPEPATSPR